MRVGEIETEWNGRKLVAAAPRPLADGLSLPALSTATARGTERAVAAVRRASDLLPIGFEPLVRLLLRDEGIASSAIEEVRAPLEQIVAAETGRVGGAAAWVADNLAVVTAAVASARREPLSADLLHRWHRTLMTHATNHLEPQFIGTFRKVQGWIGGANPFVAAYVPPPPALLPGLMDDLVEFANSDCLDPVTQAAVLHAQFETIHPYADGNGRLGRVLVGWLLVRRIEVTVPPPTSVYIWRDRGGYLAGLTMYRLGQMDRWVGWFAGVLEAAADDSVTLVERVVTLQADWRARLSRSRTRSVRSGSAVRRLLDVLPEQPVLSAASAAELLGVSGEAARSALVELERLGMLSSVYMPPEKPGRPARWWAASAILDIIAVG